MSFTVFGSNTPVGSAFLELTGSNFTETWGRKNPRVDNESHVFFDLSEKVDNNLKPLKGVLVSFAPIWLLAPFLHSVAITNSKALQQLEGVIATSSSSFLTKRFAYNSFDRDLAKRLIEAQELLIKTCQILDIPCQILAPTMIYGSYGQYRDKNINTIIGWMRRFPILVLPRNSGLRQPIHAAQLALVAENQAHKISCKNWDSTQPSILSLGGDEILSYNEMVRKVQMSLENTDPGRKCRIIEISKRLHFLMAAPILPLNPKLFEAILRIHSNLSGFTKSCDIIGASPKFFPVQRYSDRNLKNG